MKQLPEFTEINNMQDVNDFLTACISELNFHPDNDFTDYVNRSGEACFSEAEAAKYENLLDMCFHICQKENVCIYGICLDIMSNDLGSVDYKDEAIKQIESYGFTFDN